MIEGEACVCGQSLFFEETFISIRGVSEVSKNARYRTKNIKQIWVCHVSMSIPSFFGLSAILVFRNLQYIVLPDIYGQI